MRTESHGLEEAAHPTAPAELEVRVRRQGKPYLNVRLQRSPATIGRDEGVDVRLESPKVSRLHAHLVFDGVSVRIVDAGSRNGLSVGGVPQTEAALDPDTTVTISDFALRVRQVPTSVAVVPEPEPLRGREMSDGWSEIEAGNDAEREYTSIRAQPTAITRLPPEPAPELVDVGGHDGTDQGDPAALQSAELDGAEAPATGELQPDLDGTDGDEPPDAQAQAEREEEDDELAAPDLPALLTVLRDEGASLLGSEADGSIAVEVIFCIGDRVQEVALVPAGESWWWGGKPRWPATLWTAPSIDHFPLVVHRAPGVYLVQVPQDSTWKLFHRGTTKLSTHRAGHLMGMQVQLHDQAEASSGAFTVYLRCVRMPPRVPRDRLRLARPDRPLAVAALLALLFHTATMALRIQPLPPLTTHSNDVFVEYYYEAPQEIEGILKERPPTEPVTPLQLQVAEHATTAEELPAEPEPPRAPKREQRTARKQDERRNKHMAEPAAAPKRELSVADFRVVGMLDHLPDVKIEPGKGPPLRSGPALLRDGRASTTGLVDKSGRAMEITPVGRLESGQVSRVVNRHTRQISACYDQGLRQESGLRGRLELQWVVDAEGKVGNVRVLFDELGSPLLTRCMKETVASWTFPPPKGGPALVRFPFRFTDTSQ